MKVSPFCPEYCEFIQDDEGWKHETCLHAQDIIMPTPFSAIMTFGRDKRIVTVVGINRNDYYVEEIMSNGETSRSVVKRDRVERS
jgi:hypothetical protein